MPLKHDSPNHHRYRSEFIRTLVQRTFDQAGVNTPYGGHTPRTIVQFWHDLEELPPDVEECIRSWAISEASGFEHRLFDEQSAGVFISDRLSARHKQVFERCYHPAMQSDYFRLCYVLIEGGFYIDADDECVGPDIAWLADDGKLKLQPLCYDIADRTMVKPAVFLDPKVYDPNWIFYFNNNPLIASPGHPVIEHALEQATHFIEIHDKNELPEIQMATGPGNLSKSIFHLGTDLAFDIQGSLTVLKDWELCAVSKWPLSYRNDARNWRLSNQKKF